ncbi:MAG: ATP-dependent Lon protease [Planctomycetota bacterium]|jgi:ATP-dependent Lon protease
MPPHSKLLPALILRSTVLLPGQVSEFEISRSENLLALGELAKQQGDLIVAVPVLKPRSESRAKNLANVAVLCRVLRLLQLPEGSVRVTVQVLHRAHVVTVKENQSAFSIRLARPLNATFDSETCAQARDDLIELLREDKRFELEFELLQLNEGDPWSTIDLVRSFVPLNYDQELELLAEPDFAKQLEIFIRAANRQHRIDGHLTSNSESSAHQIDDLRAEPGDAAPHELEVRALEDRIAFTALSGAARDQAQHELDLFRRVRPATKEAARIRNYLDWMLALPWDFDTNPPPVAFESVEEVLAKSHTGLRDAKDRVIEHLAVRLLARRAHGTVLCFLGPPGTGKSSMGRTVAEALGRSFVQIPGGTVTEEEQLRGTPYRQDGALPGAILQSLHRSDRSDPVIMIDEIDKLELGGSGVSGGALLDILDPDQNSSFLDHYLGVPYDLSRCIFIVTANDRDDISEAVLDRLEVIEFGGFTEREKQLIAREHLMPKVRAAHGLEKQEFRITPAAMHSIVRSYTEEAGVRHLQRLLNSLARKAAVSVIRGGGGVQVKKDQLFDVLGPALVDEDLRPHGPAIGIATGLAWTSVGGTLLPVEALAMPGSGRMTLTGMVGDVMRESVQTAISFVRTRFSSLNIDHGILDTIDLHLHFPAGATPKDGPSAGLAIAVALISLVGRESVRPDLAMTGEVSLHGNVLAVGGLKEKLLAAVRAGITEVIVPERNHEEVQRLDSEIRDNLVIHLIAHVQEAFDIALVRSIRSNSAPKLNPRRSKRKRSAKAKRTGTRRRKNK